jgi:hypothetical protein
MVTKKPKLGIHSLSLAVLGGILLGLSSSGQAAFAGGTAWNAPALLDFGQGDYVYNYDFETTTVAQNNVDWAMSIIAYNNASINKFKSTMDNFNYGATSSDAKHASLHDAGNTPAGYFEWDNDKGKKIILCPAWNSTPHYRVYADSNDYLYQTGRGAYVLASTHRDRDECGGGNKAFYDSETVEGGITNNLDTYYTVYHDRYFWNNYEPYRSQGTHIWDNNGYGSYVDMY